MLVDGGILEVTSLEVTGSYLKLLKVTGRLLEVTASYWKLLEVT